ncbi:MAG: ribonuclease P protein component [Dehalococcoidia bacterium]
MPLATALLLNEAGMRREQRLRQSSDFTAVYRKGKPFRSDLLVLRVLRSGREPSRVGFTVGKALGNAVQRNLVKRRLREAARSLPLQGGWDVVVNARRGAAEAGYWNLREQMSALMGRAGVLQESHEG